jgi:hypothetical protein
MLCTNALDFTWEFRVLRSHLAEGARSTADHPEHMDVLALLLVSEIWLKEGNLKFEQEMTFEVFDFLSKKQFDKAVEVLPHDNLLKERTKLVTKARNLQEAALFVLRRDSFNAGSNIESDSNTTLSFEFNHFVHGIVVKDLGIPSTLRNVHLRPSGQPHFYTLQYQSTRLLVESPYSCHSSMRTWLRSRSWTRLNDPQRRLLWRRSSSVSSSRSTLSSMGMDELCDFF